MRPAARPHPPDLRGILIAFDLLGFAGILVDEAGVVHGQSARATVLWSDLFGAPGDAPAEQAALWSAIVADAAAAGAAGRAAIPTTLARRNGRPVIVHAAMVAPGPEEGTPAAAILMLLNPDEVPELSTPFLRGAFGLTGSEIALARHLCRGRSLKEIARLRQTSIATIRVQLRGLFAKTRTKRQAELVALLSRLPPEFEGPPVPH